MKSLEDARNLAGYLGLQIDAVRTILDGLKRTRVDLYNEGWGLKRLKRSQLHLRPQAKSASNWMSLRSSAASMQP